MEVSVEMWAFEDGRIRTVVIPDEKIREEAPHNGILELVFYYGQNEIQPLGICSVSVGDVVLLNGKRFRCAISGWEELDEEAYLRLVMMSKEKRLSEYFA
jgi:hypothetical protein